MRKLILAAALVASANVCGAADDVSEIINLFKGDWGRLFAANVDIEDEKLLALSGEINYQLDPEFDTSSGLAYGVDLDLDFSVGLEKMEDEGDYSRIEGTIDGYLFKDFTGDMEWSVYFKLQGEVDARMAGDIDSTRWSLKPVVTIETPLVLWSGDTLAITAAWVAAETAAGDTREYRHRWELDLDVPFLYAGVDSPIGFGYTGSFYLNVDGNAYSHHAVIAQIKMGDNQAMTFKYGMGNVPSDLAEEEGLGIGYQREF